MEEFKKKEGRSRRSHTLATESPTQDKSVGLLLQKTQTRMMKSVPAPEARRLDITRLFRNGKPDVEYLKDHFFREGRLEIPAAKALIETAREVFKSEPNLLELNAPVSVCGDVHGQYYDLVNVLKAGGHPSETQYLFLGDYVDRGCFSTEVCFLLFAYKICFPSTFFMLRGNHECRLMTAYFNFKLECTRKYNLEIYDEIMKCFDCLPVAATVSTKIGKFICMHGGLSPEIDNLEDIKIADRFIEPPKTGVVCDLIWSDPIEEDTATGLHEEDMESWYDVQFVENPTRGCGYIFGYSAAIQFLEENNLVSIIRAHEVQKGGYYLHHFLKNDREHPPVITVFSAPNYCDMYNNMAAVMMISQDGYEFKQISWSPHPFYLPDMIDGLNWSFPFVIENLTELSLAILNICKKRDDTEETQTPEASQVAATTGSAEVPDAFNSRVKTVGGMLRMLRQLREEREELLRLKQFAADSNDAIQNFTKAMILDKGNEKSPLAKTANPSSQTARRARSKTQ